MNSTPPTITPLQKFYETNLNIHSDIWALGCLIYEMRAGFSLFSPAIDNPPAEAVGKIVRTLGKIRSPWTHTRFSENCRRERDRCGEPILLSVERIKDPLHDQVNSIEDKLISFPDLNIGLEGSKLPKEPWKKPSSSDVNGSKTRPHIKDDPSLPWEPALSASIVEVVLIECSSPLLLVHVSMEKCVAPLRKISVKESTSLTDLLSKILTYKPENHIPASNIAKHPWLTASVEACKRHHLSDLKPLMA